MSTMRCQMTPRQAAKYAQWATLAAWVAMAALLLVVMATEVEMRAWACAAFAVIACVLFHARSVSIAAQLRGQVDEAFRAGVIAGQSGLHLVPDHAPALAPAEDADHISTRTPLRSVL